MSNFFRRVWFWFLWPGLFVYFIRSKRARVLLLSDTNETLLIQDNSRIFFDKTSWTVPGGGIRRHETPTAGAIREVYEELGIGLSADALRLLGTEKSGQYGLRYQAYFFVATIPRDIPLLLSPAEVTAATWLPLDQQLNHAKPELRQVLKLLARD